MTVTYVYPNPSSQAPAANAFSITPNDTAFITKTRGIYVGGTGDLVVQTTNGQQVTFKAVPVGVIIPVEVVLVKSTGTTATFLIGLY